MESWLLCVASKWGGGAISYLVLPIKLLLLAICVATQNANVFVAAIRRAATASCVSSSAIVLCSKYKN